MPDAGVPPSTISLDGFAASPNQSEDNSLWVGGTARTTGPTAPRPAAPCTTYRPRRAQCGRRCDRRRGGGPPSSARPPRRRDASRSSRSRSARASDSATAPADVRATRWPRTGRSMPDSPRPEAPENARSPAPSGAELLPSRRIRRRRGHPGPADPSAPGRSRTPRAAPRPATGNRNR